jgi:hypothetical protein
LTALLQCEQLLHWPPVVPPVCAAIFFAQRAGLRCGLWAAVVTIGSHYLSDYLTGDDPMFDLVEDGLIFISMLVTVVIAAVLVHRTEMRPSFLSRPRSIADTDPLPFTSNGKVDKDGPPTIHGTSACYWDVVPSGVWELDLPVGEEYFRIFLDRILHGSVNCPELSWILRDMIVFGGRRPFSGLEAGFIMAMMDEIKLREMKGGLLWRK